MEGSQFTFSELKLLYLKFLLTFIINWPGERASWSDSWLLRPWVTRSIDRLKRIEQLTYLWWLLTLSHYFDNINAQINILYSLDQMYWTVQCRTSVSLHKGHHVLPLFRGVGQVLQVGDVGEGRRHLEEHVSREPGPRHHPSCGKTSYNLSVELVCARLSSPLNMFLIQLTRSHRVTFNSMFCSPGGPGTQHPVTVSKITNSQAAEPALTGIIHPA